MSKPFLIRHPVDRREYELDDPAYFVSHYQPQGFELVVPAPTGYSVPDLPAADAEPVETDPTKMKRDALNAYAASLGIEGAEHYPNKDALLTAVDAALSASHDEGEDA